VHHRNAAVDPASSCRQTKTEFLFGTGPCCMRQGSLDACMPGLHTQRVHCTWVPARCVFRFLCACFGHAAGHSDAARTCVVETLLAPCVSPGMCTLHISPAKCTLFQLTPLRHGAGMVCEGVMGYGVGVGTLQSPGVQVCPHTGMQGIYSSLEATRSYWLTLGEGPDLITVSHACALRAMHGCQQGRVSGSIQPLRPECDL